MAKVIFPILFILTISFSYAQTQDTLFFYTFKIENINNHGSAKGVISNLRVITNQKLISFNNDTDMFLIKSKFNYVEQDLFDLIESKGYNIVD